MRKAASLHQNSHIGPEDIWTRLQWCPATYQSAKTTAAGRPERPGPPPLWLVRVEPPRKALLATQASLTAQRPWLYVRTLKFSGQISI